MTAYECYNKLIRRLYPCDELASSDIPYMLEPYEEDVLVQLAFLHSDSICCHAFTRYEEDQVYFEVYVIDPARNDEWVRFVIYKDKRLPEEEEKAFLKYMSDERVVVDEDYFSMFLKNAAAYIEGLSIEGYLPGAFVLKHMYYCYHKSGPKELLYKAGLCNIADRLEYISDINLLADNIEELFDGMNLRLIRMFNLYNTVHYIYSKKDRLSLKKIYKKYGSYMKNRYLEESEILYLHWCQDGITEFDNDIYKFVGYLDPTEELIDYMLYLELRKKINVKWGFPKVFANSEEMYQNLEELDQLEEVVGNESYYNGEIHRLISNRMNLYHDDSDDYEIIIPDSVHCIIEESSYQKNCLVRYIPEYALGFTDLVFFVSKNSKEHLTMRAYNGVLEEVKGRYNRKLDDKEQEFIRTYCEKKQIRHNMFD